MSRPNKNEAASYYSTYIDKVVDEDFLAELVSSRTTSLDLMDSLTTAQWNHAYDTGKWTLKEVFLHIIDAERIFAYRALRVARGDTTPIPGFEQDDYVATCNAAKRSAASIMDEYSAVRAATIELFQHFDDEMLSRFGTASNNPVTPRALGFMIAGHENHHIEIVKERYLT